MSARLIPGNPAAPSRAAALRDAAALLQAGGSDGVLRRALGRVARARVLVTPVCKAAGGGSLKLFLDLLPPTAFRGKPGLLATGGSARQRGLPLSRVRCSV